MRVLAQVYADFYETLQVCLRCAEDGHDFFLTFPYFKLSHICALIVMKFIDSGYPVCATLLTVQTRPI